MSRHHLRTALGGTPVLVVMGYDRPLDEFFVQLWPNEPGSDVDEPLYSSLDEPAADWRDIASVVRKLAELGMQVPRSMIDAVAADGAQRAGNRIVEHAPEGGMTALHS
jgi:hypothetical protein